MLKRVMKKKGERGLSTIVATLLIILLTLVAVGIIWVVVRNVIQSGAEQVSLGKFTLDLKISQVQILNESSLSVTIKRNTGEGDFVGINFIVEDDFNAEIIKRNISMKELETRKFQLDLSLTNTSNIKKISIAPIFRLESGKEVIGDIKDEYIVPPCIPNCAGRVCGADPVCGQSCGNCITNYECDLNGLCIAPAWQTNLISWWKFDGNALDSIGTNHGTVNGATLTNTDCKSGQCYSFDGINDYINCGNGVLFNSSKPATISFWAKLNGYNVLYPVPLILKTDQSTGFIFFYSNYGSYSGFDFGSNLNFVRLKTEGSIGLSLAGELKHFIIVYDGTSRTTSSSYKLYIDGIEQSLVTTSAFAAVPLVNNISSITATQQFNGSIDEIMIWDRNLSLTEVQEVYDYNFVCTPSCVGKVCGSDGCSGSCGTCSTGETCNLIGQCIPSWQTDLISWWKFDGNALDSIGTNDGTVNGSTLMSTGCVSGQCYSFDGVDDIITIPDSNVLSFTNGAGTDLPFSIGTWIKRSGGTSGWIINKRGTSQEWQIALYNNNLSFGIFSGGSSAIYISTLILSPLTTNIWYHIVGTYNGSETNEGMNIYINGVQQSMTMNSAGTYVGTSNTTSQVRIGGGGWTTPPSYLFNGSLDEVMVFNRSLSSTEVQEVYDYY